MVFVLTQPRQAGSAGRLVSVGIGRVALRRHIWVSLSLRQGWKLFEGTEPQVQQELGGCGVQHWPAHAVLRPASTTGPFDKVDMAESELTPRIFRLRPW